jgi:hypothetical protein
LRLESVAQSVTHFLRSESTIIIRHTVRAGLYNFCREFSILRESCAYCRQRQHGQILQQHDVPHKALLSVGSQTSFVFSLHKLFFRTHIYQHGSVVKTVILQAIAHAQRHQSITRILAYSDYVRVADTIDSQKLEDHDITDELP